MTLCTPFTKWNLPVLLLPERNMFLRKMKALVQHYTHHILHNIWPMYKSQVFPLLWIYGILPLGISSSGDVLGIKLGTADVLFVSVSSESFWLGYSAPSVSLFLIWLCGSWLLIKFSLNCKKTWSTKEPYSSNFVLFRFATSWTPSSCRLFRYVGGKHCSNSVPSLIV